MDELITTALELVAFVLLAAAVAMALWLLWPPLSLAGAASVLLVASWIIDRRLASDDDGDGVQ